MARLNDAQRTALGYWYALITDAVHAGFSASETQQLAAQVREDLGLTGSLEENRAIAVLYGYAKREDNAALAFQNADVNAVITPDLVATPAYARDEAEQNSYPLYHVRFYYTYIDSSGEEHTTIKTSAQSITLGPTKADVISDVLADAGGFAAKYGHQLVSAIPFQILAV